MDYQYWSQHFNKAANDLGLAAAISQAGITKPLTIESDGLSVAADVPGQGLTIVFTDESILRPEMGTVGKAILSSVVMLLRHPSTPDLYRGRLPYGLTPETSQSAMRHRFGAPIESGDGRPWDIFQVDGLEVSPTYARDLKSIARLALRIPGGR